MFIKELQMPQSQFTLETEGGEAAGGEAPAGNGFMALAEKTFDALNQPDAPEKETPDPVVEKAPDADPANKDGETVPGQEKAEEVDEATLKRIGLDARTLADFKEGKILPHHRFKEVQEKLKAYETFGTPESLQELQKAVSAYKEFGSPEVLRKLLESSKPPTKETPETPELSDEDKQTQEYFFKLFPDLKKRLQGDPESLKKLSEIEKTVGEIKAKEKAEFEQRQERTIKAGEDKVRALAKAKGIDVSDPERFEIIAEGVAATLNRDPELRRRFWVEGDIEALAKPFEDYYSKMFSGFQVKAAADILSGKKSEKKISSAPVKTGTSDAETPPDAGKLSWTELAKKTADSLG